MGDDFNPLSAKDVREIETAVGAKLDDSLSSLRFLLLTYGSFRFRDYGFYTPVKPFPKAYSNTNRGIVGTFLGKFHPQYPRARSISIAHRIDLLRPELPPKFLPFADNGAGDLLGVSLSARETGRVFLWIHDGVEGKDFCLVNRSFDKWLKSLTTK